MANRPTIAEVFGLEMDMNDKGQWELIPPPPNVLAVLVAIGNRQKQQPEGHGPKTQKRRSKRRRLRARDRFLQRTTWRRYFEEEKRRAKENA